MCWSRGCKVAGLHGLHGPLRVFLSVYLEVLSGVVCMYVDYDAVLWRDTSD